MSSLGGLSGALDGLGGLGDVGVDDIDLHLKLLSMMDNPAVIVAAAAAGKVEVIKEYLKRRPKDVCAVYAICVVKSSSAAIDQEIKALWDIFASN